MKLTVILTCALCVSASFGSEVRRKRRHTDRLSRDSRESNESPESLEIGGGADRQLPFDPDDFVNFVLDFERSPYLEDRNLSALCGTAGQYRSGYLIGLWDPTGRLESVEKVKCVRGDKDYDDRSDEYDDVYYELDWDQHRTIQLDPSSELHKPNCPDGYLLTGLTRSETTSLPIVGHCHKLIRGVLRQDMCERVVPTGVSGGGRVHPYVQWNAECPFGYAAIGLKVDEKSVMSMRCCKLTPDPNLYPYFKANPYPRLRPARSVGSNLAYGGRNANPAAAAAGQVHHQVAAPAPQAAAGAGVAPSNVPLTQAAEIPVYVLQGSAESPEDLYSPENRSPESHSWERLIVL